MIDQYFNRKYDSKEYNCAHFVTEVWRNIKGVDVSLALGCFMAGIYARCASFNSLRNVILLSKPENPCLIYFQAAHRSHVGIWLDGRVLHIGPGGVQYIPLEVAALGFKKVRFFKC